MFKKLVKYAKIYFTYFFCFGPQVAVKLAVIHLFLKNKPPYDINNYKHKVIKEYLKKRYIKVINDFREKHNKTDPSFAENYPVWFLWWQGESNMPPIVKVCYQTLKKYSNGHVINLLTKDNLYDFINLPDYVIKKAEKNIISLTHFSDIIRVCLLYEHGGLWLDSTVLLTAPLQSLPQICSQFGFWTPKDDGVILELCFKARNWIVRENRWLTFCIYLSKHNILAEFLRIVFFLYVKSKNHFIDYFLFDYFISIAYDTLPEIRIMIDSVPENNPKVHEIYHRLNLNYEYNSVLFENICNDTFFHKLNWKEDFKEYTETGKLTNYGYIIKNYPPK